MKKTALIASGAIAGGALAAFLGATWWAGKATEETLTKQNQLIADLPYFIIKSHDYQRGLFSSSERTTVAINPALIEPYFNMLKPAGQQLPKLELTYVQHVKHGPFPLLGQGSLSPLKAAVTTDIEFSEESKKFLAQFFGEQKPLQIENRIKFHDDGVFLLKIPSFTHEEALSKVKSIWQGLEASIAYDKGFNKVDILAKAPGLRFEAGAKGSFEFKNLTFEAHNNRKFSDPALESFYKVSSSGLMLGEGKFTLDEVTAHASLSENEKPIDAKLETLTYVVKSGAQGDFIDATGDIGLKTLTLNGKVYGPVRIAVEANHLHGPTLSKLNMGLTAVQKSFPDPAVQYPKMLDMLRKDGLPLLRNDPSIGLKELSVKLPEGQLLLKGNLALKGFEDRDIDMPLKVLEKLQATVNLRVPKKVIETYALWKARGSIATDTTEGERPDTEDLDSLARNLMENQIKKLTEQNLIRVDGDSLTTIAEWKSGKLIVNGTPLPLPWQAVPPAGAAGTEATPAAQ